MRLRDAPRHVAATLLLGLRVAASAQEVPGAAPLVSENAPATAGRNEGTEPVEVRPHVAEELTVTGTRIRRKDLTTPAPVTVVSREQLQASGKVSLGDFLQSLPEQGNAFNTALNNGGDGATRVSLRSLGAQRTLVLLNGRRLVPGGLGADSAVDLNAIPAAIVERIEILKDGASAIYGSDALAGVVNIITRRRFTGAELSSYAGISSRGDGATHEVNGTVGASGARSSLMLSAGIYQQQPVWAGDRAFSRTSVGYDQTGLNNPLGNPPGEYTFGNGAVPAGSIGIDVGARGQPVPNPGNDPRLTLYNSLVTTYPEATKFIRDPSSPLGWRPFVSQALPPAGDAYNYAAQNYLVTPQQRISLFSVGEHALGDHARVSCEASYLNRQSSQVLDPEPLTLGPGGTPVAIARDSIYNPFGIDITSAERRLVEFGPRRFAQDVDSYRFVAAVDGFLPEAAGPLRGWAWDVSLNYGRTTASQLTSGSLRGPGLQAALGPSFVDPLLGPQCGHPGNVIAGCVPLDLFGGPGTVTPAMRQGLTFSGVARGSNQLAAVQANAAGELFHLWSDVPVGLSLGYEFRRVAGAFTPDPVTAAGETTGNQVAPVAGSYEVNEGYGELSVPLASRLPLAETVEATVAARVFRYSNFGSDWSYKVGGRWSPTRDVTLRGTHSTAFRAPSIADLYLGQQDSFAPVQDPCGDAATAPASCGAAAGNGDDQAQLRSRIGGNPALRPETARIVTLGLVVQPRWVQNLTVTFDYYRIAVDRAVGGIGEATILASCYPADPSVTPTYCDLVHRDPATQRIDTILNTSQNVGKERVSGVDFALRYAFAPSGAGRFALFLDGTWLEAHDLTLADGTVVRGAGNYDLSIQNYGGIQGVNPAWKLNVGATWSLAGFGAGLSTRFVGSFRECGDPNGDYSGSGLCFIDSTHHRQVASWNSWDGFVTYGFTTPAGRSSVGLGVQNAFDSAPPRIYNGFVAASDPTAYDYTGRFVYLRLVHRL